MMSCAELEKSLFDLLDGRLPGPDELRAHSHLERCATCRERLEAWRRAVPAMRAAVPSPPDFLSMRRMELAITRELSRAPAQAPPARRLHVWWATGVILAAAAAVVVVQLSRRPEPPLALAEAVSGGVTAAGRPIGQGDALPVGLPVTVSASGRLSAAVGRAATIEASSGAHLTIAQATAAVVIRLDAGELEARVEPRRPGERFAVELAGGRVEVRGTRFLVGYRDGGTWLRVDEGTVAAFDAAGRLTRLVPAGENHWLSPAPPAAPPPPPAEAPAPAVDTCAELQRSCASAVARTRAAIRASDGPRAVAASSASGIAVGGCGLDGARQCLDELQYLRAEALRLTGRLPAAVTAYHALDRSSATATTRQNALFAAAELQRRLGRLPAALRDYQRAHAVAGAAGLREEALLGVMETAEALGDAPRALAAARQYVASYPSGHGTPRARSLIQRQGTVPP
jgi:anti-sigma factor RsiW